MNHFKVRQTFLQFFKNRGHEVLPSSSISGTGDPSLLFVNAGMNQFKDVFLGLKPAPAKNVVTIQKCLRAGGKHNDLEMVGETPLHHTFFEMLGNFSFGDYFKEKAIALAWEFLTQELKLDKENLWITVHKKDEQSYQIWREQEKIPEHKILNDFGDEDNFWKMGETGPCGYCSEIHYYAGKEERPKPSQLMEIWNLVFMEFNQLSNGKKEELARPCVDTGMGLERLCAVLQGKVSNYETDLFKSIIVDLEKASGLKYNFKDSTKESFKKASLAEKNTEAEKTETSPLSQHKLSKNIKTQSIDVETQKAFRVLADHSRAVAFLIHEGLLPGSSEAEYVLRRIMRRAFYYGWKLNKKQTSNSHKASHPDKVRHPDHARHARESGHPKTSSKKLNFLSVGVKKVIETMSRLPSELSSKLFSETNLGYSLDLKKDEHEIQTCINNEAGQFLSIITEGEKEWEKLRKLKHSKKTLTAKELWNLYSTYGLPIELSQLKFKEWGWQIATDEEVKKYKSQIEKDLSSGLYDIKKEEIKHHALKFCHARLDRHARESGHPNKQKTQWTAYQKIKEEGQVLGLAFIPQAFPFTPNKTQSQETRHPQKVRYPYPDRHARESGHPAEASPIETFQKTPISSFNAPISDKAKGFIIMDKTCFYPEGGGPIGDKGWLFRSHIKGEPKPKPIAKVLDCQKIGDTILHEVEFITANKSIEQGEKLLMEVNKDFREGIKSAHTATHLLNSALRNILDSSVRQAGSLVEPYRLRFDFTHPRPLTKKEISQIEEKLRQNILAKEDLKAEIKNFDQAEKEGALFLKAEKKYGNKVRVISIGAKSSKELCGGIHVQNTCEIEAFKVIAETGVQSGVRRITAYTGVLAKAFEEFLIKENLNLRKQIHIPKTEESPLLSENPFLKWLENHKEELKTLRNKIVRLEEASSTLFKKPKTESQDKAENKTNLSLKNINLRPKKEDDFISQKPEEGFSKTTFHPLAKQMLELREHLKLPLPKEKNTEAFWNKQISQQSKDKKIQEKINFLNFFEEHLSSLKDQEAQQNIEDNFSPVLKTFKEKEKAIQELNKQWEKIQSLSLTKQKLLTQAKEFRFQKIQGQEIKGKLLTVKIPLEDRKILSDLSDSLLSALAPGVLILLGEGESKAPILVNITKDLAKVLSANEILKKTIIPLCQGQGGGRPHFAQGSISQASGFSKVEPTLLEQWK